MWKICNLKIIISERQHPHEPKDELPDTEKVGISGPPIENPEGWLLLYHCVSRKTQPMTYYVAAALLDLKDLHIFLPAKSTHSAAGSII